MKLIGVFSFSNPNCFDTQVKWRRKAVPAKRSISPLPCHGVPPPKKGRPAPSPFSPENLLHVIPVFKKRRVEAVPPLPDAGVRSGMGSLGNGGWLCSDRVKQVPCFSVVPYSVANKDFPLNEYFQLWFSHIFPTLSSKIFLLGFFCQSSNVFFGPPKFSYSK